MDEEKAISGPDTTMHAQEQTTTSEKLSSAEQLPDNHDAVHVVDWDGPDDPANPMNWSPTRKWITIAIVSFSTLNV